MKTSIQHTKQKDFMYKVFLGTTTAALMGSLGVPNIDNSIEYTLLKSKYIYEKPFSTNANEPYMYLSTIASKQSLEIENFRNLVNFSEDIIKNNIKVDEEIAKIIDDNFMDLLA